MKRIITIIFLSILLVFSLSACSLSSDITSEVIETPTVKEQPYLTDEGFAEIAVTICDELEISINNIDSFLLFAAAYRGTAEKFNELYINFESAPQAIILRTNMMDFAEISESFDREFVIAMEQSGIRGISTLITTDDGTMIAVEGLMDKTVQLDIDKDIVLDIMRYQDAVNDAAEALGLDGCHVDYFSILDNISILSILEATSTPQGPIKYTVQGGPSRRRTTVQFGVSGQSIISVNNLSSSCELLVGSEVLIIP